LPLRDNELPADECLIYTGADATPVAAANELYARGQRHCRSTAVSLIDGKLKGRDRVAYYPIYDNQFRKQLDPIRSQLVIVARLMGR
jgi:hypothetical protein